MWLFVPNSCAVMLFLLVLLRACVKKHEYGRFFMAWLTDVRDFDVYLRKLLKANTMNKQIILLLLLMAVSVLTSCEKFNDDGVIDNKEANSTLVIRTRAAQAEGAASAAEISYPVNIYVFNESDKCVEVVQIASEDDALSLKLPEGRYDVYALAGTDAEAYELPTKENATKDAVVALKSGHGHGDVMTAHNAVTLAYGEENTLTLSLERKVMMLESVTINNVPASVTAVAVSVSPLYENIKLDGGYSGENGEYKADLVCEEGGNIWKSSGAVYLLEAAGAATVKVAFTSNGKTHSYSYLCPKELKANYKVTISGTYSGDGVKLNGSITGAEWAGTTDVTFVFDETGEGETVVPGDEDEPSGGDVVAGTVPEVGSLYNGGYVLRRNDDEKTVTLMSPKCLAKLVFTEGDQESLKAAVDGGIAELAVEGITGWRLANVEEINYMRNHWEEIKGHFDAMWEGVYDGIDYFDASKMYYCQVGDEIYTYNLKDIDGEPVFPDSGSSSYVLRAFTTIPYVE